MNDLVETFTIFDGYDKRKTRRQLTVRKFTLEDIRALPTKHDVLFIDRHGEARVCRRSSALKTWKSDPLRFECSFKYGLYESFRLTTQQMLNELLIEV